MVLSGYVGHLQRSLDEAVSHLADMVEERDELRHRCEKQQRTIESMGRSCLWAFRKLSRQAAPRPAIAGATITVNPW